jgi:circadian clock protein KaiB
MKSRKKPAGQSKPETDAMVLRLYISKNAPNSVLALSNITAISGDYVRGKIKLEIIDVLEYPLRALADGILVTPCLTKVSPLPGAKIVGNLNDKGKVLLGLGLEAIL